MRNDHIRRLITEKLSESLRMEPSKIRSDAPFADYGVDSIIGVNLVRTISEALQIELETTSLFEYSTVDQLADYIARNWQTQFAAQGAAPPPAQELSAPEEAPRFDVPPPSEGRFAASDLFAASNGQTQFAAPAAPPPLARESSAAEEALRSDVPPPPEVPFTAGGQFAAGDAREVESEPGRINVEPVAIIGMSGRFAQSESLDAFWTNLAQGKNLIRQVSRWKASDCVASESAGQAHCSHGSFLDSADLFDPAFFGISPEEAKYMDPQQRVFLEESWRALEDAGYASRSGTERQCGVYVGVGTSNYTDLFVDEPPAQAWWGNSPSVVPARIAYHLNLQGPAIAVDTACSSVLVAIHLACQGLWSGEIDMALAGGVYVQATSTFHKVANRAGMLTPDGRCRSFDARANGFAPAEAVGAIVVKRLRDALRDGDHIHGVIAGSGINQDGSSNGLIAPNARAQERLERSVYEKFDIDPATIQMVEAHGTATLMGDSIEVLAISRAFREFTDRRQFCAIGSVKTNIGHAGNAAGIASILKILLAFRQGQIPPSLHYEKSNPAIDFENSPFFVNTELRDWIAEEGGRRRAAVSAFGFSGTNAHLVLEEPPAVERTVDSAPAYVVPLSARTSEQLQQQARNLLEMLRSTPDVSMNDLAFSLFAGRVHLGHRLSCVARNPGELIDRLGQWLDSGSAPYVYLSDAQQGKIREQAVLRKLGSHCIEECRAGVDTAAYLENAAAIAELYALGYTLDYESLFPAGSRRIPLPTYPFARERYWVDAPQATSPRAAVAAPAWLHPLLHANVSTLGRQCYRA
ncbi:MAG TPA: beta-ketoacyl synthase N-terminal-like domain-containing protein, partial [Thermoanaerobaculia bacterium]|nr:beta-ketoacyl synthase N-terminal-like domain-containing protein [Thermoanaerobaculia bacterium]